MSSAHRNVKCFKFELQFYENAILSIFEAIFAVFLKEILKEICMKTFFQKKSKFDLIMGRTVQIRRLNNLKLLWLHYLAISIEESLDSDLLNF